MGRNKKQRKAAIEGDTPSLPREIIYSILSRLPVKSLLRFRCVCKSWLVVISEPQFMKTHLKESIKSDRQRLLCRPATLPDCFYSIGYDISDNSNEKLYLPLNKKLLVDIYCSCNGLVLLGVDHDKTWVLWNPSTRAYRKFSSPFSVYTFCGLCYDSSIDDYKVVLVSNPHFDEFLYVVFSLKGNSWTNPRKFTHVPIYTDTHDPINTPLYGESGVNVNGVFHFIAKSSNYLTSDSGTDYNSDHSGSDYNSDYSGSEISSSSGPHSSSEDDNKGHHSSSNKSYSSLSDGDDGDGDPNGEDEDEDDDDNYNSHCQALFPSMQDSDDNMPHSSSNDDDDDDNDNSHCQALFPSMQDSADDITPYECDLRTAYANIVFFDAVNEKFEEMLPPICIYKRDVFGLMVVKGCLGLYCSTRDGKQAEVWVMKEHGEMNSWTKLIIIRHRLQGRFLKHYLRPICVTKKGEIVMVMGEKSLVIYNPKENKFRNLITPNMGHFKVVSFVDSLVLPAVD